jgi:hypothetical protein
VAIQQHAVEFAGQPVREYDPEVGIDDPSGSAYRLSVEFDDGDTFMVKLAQFLEDPGAREVRGIVIG